MQNFSKATDIDLCVCVEVRIEPLIGNGVPRGRIMLDGIGVFDGLMHHPVTVSRQIELCDDILLVVDLSEKVYDSTKETAIHILSITVDGLEIKDHCYDLIQYHNDQNVDAQTFYLGYNGKWILRIPGPFYRWWHAVSGQGWLLSGARSISRGFAANSTSTKDGSDRNGTGNSARDIHPTKDL